MYIKKLSQVILKCTKENNVYMYIYICNEIKQLIKIAVFFFCDIRILEVGCSILVSSGLILRCYVAISLLSIIMSLSVHA